MLHRLIIVILGVLLAIAFFLDEQILIILEMVKSPFLNYFFQYVASWPAIIAIYLILPLAFQKRLTNLATTGGSMVFSIAIAWGFKFLFMRPRPFQLLAIKALELPKTPAFPSVHAAAVVAAAFTLSKRIPQIKALWLSYAALVSFGRIWIGVHWPSDCIASALLGLLIGFGFLKFKKDKFRIS